MNRIIVFFVSFGLMSLIVAFQSGAQILDSLAIEDPPPTKESPLGVRQQRIKRMMVDLERKFTELAEKLQQEQPEEAAKLEEAFKRSKELLLMQRMDEVTKLLDTTKLESADDEQGLIVDDIKLLIDLLLYEQDAFEQLMNQIERLEAWKAQLEKLIDQETALKEEADILANREAALAELDRQIAEIEALIEKQAALEEETSAAEAKTVDDLDRMADDQAALREETDAFSQSLVSPGERREDGEKEQPPAAGATRAQQAASEAVRRAVEDQRSAEGELAAGQREQAGRAQKNAITDLQSALDTLQQEQERVEKLGPEAGQQLAGQQDQTAGQTEEVGRQMSEAGEQAEELAGARENVQQAEQEMNAASKNLAQNQPGQAGGQQDEAVKQLQQARDEVERQLNEKRDEAQREQLARLGEVFQKMLEEQRKVNGGVKEIDERRGGDQARLRRADRIALRKLTDGQRSLENDAANAEALLVDDGTSIVFRDVVGYLRNEMGFVAELMEQSQTGTEVQNVQREIEMTLEELIAALENAQNQQQQNPQEGQQPGGQRQQSLFPPLAELKLLKFTQERINRQTERYENVRQKEPEHSLARRLESLVGMQDKLTGMTRQLASKLTPPPDAAEID